ncbi:MAG: AI-2E family transporter [Herpetosiphonaceae bacterium]|nr:AI-2E family transporter [Herpetosiphonaceae bacterium]
MIKPMSLPRIAGYTAAVLATLTILFVVYRLGQVVLLFVLSIIVAAALRRGILALERYHVPRGLAILLWYVVVIGIIAGGITLLGPPLQNELRYASDTLPRRYDTLLGSWKTSGLAWQQAIARRLPTTAALLSGVSHSDPATIGFGLIGLTSGIVGVVIDLVAILSLTFYWLADQERFERLWLTLLPVQQRSIARATWRDTETQVGAFVRSEAIQFVLTIGILWLGFQLLGLRYATFLALYAGFAQLIPWIGVPLTLLPLLPLAFTTPISVIVLAAGIVIVTGLLMDRILEPRLSEGAGAHPILVIVALLIMAQASGLFGMIVALPIAATFQIVLSSVVRANSAARDTSSDQEAAQVQELRAQITRLHAGLPPDPEQRLALEGMLGRLEGMVAKTETLIHERTLVTERTRRRERGQLVRGASIFERRP